MPRDEAPRWFVDESALGLAKTLATARGDVLYPGYRRLLEIPLSTPDEDWMPIVAERGLVVIIRDRHVRTKPAELKAFMHHGLRAFWIAGDRDMSTWDNLRRVVRWWDRMEHIVTTRREGPWFYALFETRVTEVVVQARVHRPRPANLTPRRPRVQGGNQLDLGI